MNLYDRLEKQEPDMGCFSMTIGQAAELADSASGTFELIGAVYKFGFLQGQRAERAEMEERMKNSTYDLATEISGVAMTITGLSNQLDNVMTDPLTVPALDEALHSVSVHLQRIADELAEMS